MLIVKGVGILTALRLSKSAGSYVPTDPSTLAIASPWSDGDLEKIVVEDIWGGQPTNTRSQAMRDPAVARARNLLVSTGCKVPMRAYRRAEARPDSDTPFLYRTGTSTSWQHRNAWTIDDLIFYGWSCWGRENDANGFPIAADRIERSRWSINDDNRVEVDGRPVNDNEVILIPGLHEGVLKYGADTLYDSRELRRVVRDRIENPTPAIDLHQTEGEDLTKDQRDELVQHWREARAKRGGAAVGYTSKAIEVHELGTGGDAQLLIEARNAASLDIARIIGVAASRIDATAPKASLNYETTNGRNQELVDFDLALYLTPIAARLSLDDVVPQGTRVAHDFSELVELAPSLTGPETED